MSDTQTRALVRGIVAGQGAVSKSGRRNRRANLIEECPRAVRVTERSESTRRVERLVRRAVDLLRRLGQHENVAVEPTEQGHGHGRALVSFAERHARECGLAAVELYTNEAMAANIRLYPRLGYVETGRRVDDGYHRVYFRKTLDARPVRS